MDAVTQLGANANRYRYLNQETPIENVQKEMAVVRGLKIGVDTCPLLICWMIVRSRARLGIEEIVGSLQVTCHEDSTSGRRINLGSPAPSRGTADQSQPLSALPNAQHPRLLLSSQEPEPRRRTEPASLPQESLP